MFQLRGRTIASRFHPICHAIRGAWRLFSELGTRDRRARPAKARTTEKSELAFFDFGLSDLSERFRRHRTCPWVPPLSIQRRNQEIPDLKDSRAVRRIEAKVFQVAGKNNFRRLILQRTVRQ